MARKQQQTTVRTKRGPGVAEVQTVEEVVDEREGPGIDDGIVLATTVALVGAIALTYVALQHMPLFAP